MIKKEKWLKAFRRTLERWEKIVENPEYWRESSCVLCDVEEEGCIDCPIRLFTDNDSCSDTPYNNFYVNRTIENAITELAFLHKVYSWYLEQEVKEVEEKEIAEEVKEEWVDVTDRLYFFPHFHMASGYDVHFSEKEDKGDWIGWIYADGEMEIGFDYKDKYEIERVESKLFKIFKRS